MLNLKISSIWPKSATDLKRDPGSRFERRCWFSAPDTARNLAKDLALVLVLFGAPGLAPGQGTIVFHNTGGGQPLVSEVRSIFLDAGAQQPLLFFDFGFATDETPSPGAFLDSFTVSIQDSAQRFSAVYLTADANGVAWAPSTPGNLFIDSAAISAIPISYPTLQPVLGRQTAFEVTAPIPAQFLGSSVNVFFDLFDNQDAKISQGWFSNVGVVSVPEPQSWALLIAGGITFWFFRRRSF